LLHRRYQEFDRPPAHRPGVLVHIF
jgi:hypothetical protein